MVAQARSDFRENTHDGGAKVQEALAGLPHREEWLIADSLEIDITYQRKSIRVGWVKQIADGFDPDLLRPLLVNRRHWDNNRLFVMDGQHRLKAILQMGWGDQLLPCLVFDNLSYETECKLFDTQGTTRPLTAQERFRSALQRHEPDQEIIDGLVRHAGYQLNLDHGDTTEGRIPGVQTLLRILRQHRSSMLGDVMDACRDGFGTDLGPASTLLDGVARFLARYRNNEHYDRRRLVTALRKKTMSGLIGEGVEIKRAMSVSVEEGIAFRIYEAYNRSLSTDRRLPEWTFGRSKQTKK